MTYTLVAEDVGRAVRVRVGFRDDRGIAKSAVSAAVAVGNTPAAGAPGLEGSARVGGRLTATTDGILDDNGLTAPVWSYQWFRTDGEAETAIGTDAASYRLVAEDLGSRIGVRVSFADDAGYAETVESVAVDVLAGSPPTDSVCGGAAFSPPEGREALWRAEVIISGITNPPAPGAGYHAGPPRQGGLTDGVNTLADRSFVLGSGSRHVVDIVMGRSGNGQLDFSLDSALTEADAASLVLHVCGESFPFADAQHDPSGHTYSWPAGAYSVWQTQSAARWVFLSIPADTGPGNRAPTGAPVIAGTARVGETLTALTDAIRDADGLASPSWTYQWLRVDGGAETEIAGETGSTYDLVAADLGKRVKVQVGFSDDGGTDESLPSDAFPASGTIAPAPSAPVSGIWSATLVAKDTDRGDGDKVGCSGSGSGPSACGNTGVLSDDDFDFQRGGRTVSFSVSGILLDGGTLEFKMSGGFTAAEAAATSLKITADGTTSTFSFADDEDTGAGNVYEWSSTGLSWSVDETVTLAIEMAPADETPPALATAGVPVGVQSSGTAIVLRFDEVIDPAGLAPAGAFAVTADAIPITVSGVARLQGNLGIQQSVNLSVSPVIRAGQRVVVAYTDPTGSDDANAIQDAAGNDAVSFTAQAANSSEVTGLPGAPTGVVATVMGQRQIDLEWTPPGEAGLSPITGYRIEWSPDGNDPWRDLVADTASTDVTYSDDTLVPGVGRHYRISAINPFGAGEASGAASAETARLVPVISGAPRVGEEVTAETDNIMDPEGLGSAVFAYTWIRVDADGMSNPAPIEDASGPAYELAKDDAGRRIVVEVSFTDGGGNPEVRRSDPFPTVGTVIANRPATGAPRISGSGRVDEALSATAGNIADADGLAGVSYVYQWYRVNAGAVPETEAIPEAQAQDYMPVAADAGHRVLVKVSFTDDAGFVEAGPDGDGIASTPVAIRAAMPPAACPAPVLAERSRIWAGTVTVGTANVAVDGVPIVHGFGGGLGSLSDTDFELGGNAYTVVGVAVGNVGRDRGTLGFGLTSDLTAAARAGLRLHLCGETYDFGDAVHDMQRHAYAWPNAGLDWSEAESRSLVLSTASPGVPDVPRDLVAGGVDNTSIALAWTEPAANGGSAIEGYRIEWSADGNAPWRDLVADTASTKTDYRDMGLSPETTRHYRVSAINARGTGSPSEVAAGSTTTGVPGTPGAPGGLTATIEGSTPEERGTEIALAWTAPTEAGDSEIAGYRIEWSPNGNDPWSELVADTGTTDVTYRDTGLASETTRHYRVSAINGAGAGVPSAPAHATTDDILGPVPRAGAVGAAGDSLALEFDEAIDTGTLPPPAAFALTADNEPIAIGSVSAAGADGIVFGALSPAIRQGQRVRLAYADPNPASDDASGVIQDGLGNDAPGFTGFRAANRSAVAPVVSGKPTGLEATARGGARIDLEWTPPADNGGRVITGYYIEVSEDSGSSWAELVASHDEVTYSHVNVPHGATRHYRISAINAVGAGLASDAAHATTDAGEGPAPVLAVLNAAASQIGLDFDENLGSPDSPPPASAFTVTVDGASVGIGSVGIAGTRGIALINPSPTIRRGQTVTVSYADPTSGDDAAAIQNADGEDAASFTDYPVRNGSTVDFAAPGQPLVTMAGADGDAVIVFAWQAPRDNGGRAITGYRVEWSADGSDPWTELVADTGNTNTLYEDSGLAPGTTRHYRVSAINALGTGTASDAADATTTKTTLPGPPTDLTAVPGLPATPDGTTLVVLAWRAPADLGTDSLPITGYRIEWSPDGMDDSWSELAADTGNTDLTYTDSGLPSAATRHYRVSAINARGRGEPSAPAEATTEDVVGPAPVSASVPATGTSVDILFDEVLDGTDYAPGGAFHLSADGVRILFDTVGTAEASDGTRRVFSLSGLARNIRADQAVVVAYTDPSSANNPNAIQDPAGNDAESFTTGEDDVPAVMNDSTVAPAVPGMPAGLRAAAADGAAGDSQIDLEWSAPEDDGGRAIGGYRIEVSADGGVNFTDLVESHAAMKDGAIETAYAHAGLSPGDTRRYRVSAINAEGTGEPSEFADAVTTKVLPGAPTGLMASAEGAMISLAWTAPAHAGEAAIAGYRIERSADGMDGSWTELVADTKNTGVTWTDPDEFPSRTTRHYRVSAINDAFTAPGPASASASATIGDLDPPVLVSAQVVGNGARLFLEFDEALEARQASAAPPEAFEVTVDGTPLDVSETLTTTAVFLYFDEDIKQGQKVVVTYTDPTKGVDDAIAIQDQSGNDAATFTTGEDGVPDVMNDSTVDPVVPGPPTGLVATPVAGTTEIDLTWTPPEYVGDTPIVGYQVEWSPHGRDGTWDVLEDDTESTDATWTDSGRVPDALLGSETTRHYRVSAINTSGSGVGSPSERAEATSADTVAPVPERAVTNGRGTQVTIQFDEPLDGAAAGLPAKELFTVSVDGVASEIGSVAVAGEARQVLLNALSPVIRHSQVVVVSYMGPTTDDDAGAIQDDISGNNAVSFTTGTGTLPAVANNSVVQPEVPGKPLELTAKAMGTTDIVLTWQPPADSGGREITGYRIEWSSDGSRFRGRVSNYAETTDDGAIATTYTRTGLAPRTTRHYRVKAINAVGTGPASETAEATTGENAPGAPTGLTATPELPDPPDGTTQIVLAWTAPTDLGIADDPADRDIIGYLIEWSPDRNGPWTERVGAEDALTDVTWTNRGLGSEETRHYRISAINAAGAGPASARSQATTADIEGPVPVSASVDAAGTALTITFNEALAEAAENLPPAASFTIGTADGTGVGIGAVAASGMAVTLSDLSPALKSGQGVTITYEDRDTADTAAIEDDDGNDAARFETGAGDVPAVTNGSTIAPTVPGKPRTPAAEARGPDRIVVTWDAPVDRGGREITGYMVEISTDDRATWAPPSGFDARASERLLARTFEDSDIPNPGATRHYRVSAMNPVGTGAASDVARAMTSAEAPEKPTELAAAAMKDPVRVELSWTAPKETGTSDITGYRIEWSPDGSDSSWKDLVADTESTGVSHTDNGSDPDAPFTSETTRHYRVSAINSQGTGSPSDSAHATTADTAGPVPVSASVPGSGAQVVIVFDEELDGTNIPAKERFTISVADGARIAIGSVSVAGARKQVLLNTLVPLIRSGQSVTVSYTDPTPDANDVSGALQDDTENDAASFADLAVANSSLRPIAVPGAPGTLSATADGENAIVVKWTAPADTGGQTITDYRIEVSPDGSAPWSERDRGGDSTDTTYRDDVGLSAGDTRHYRVSATNAQGTGPHSNVADATTVSGAPGQVPSLTATAADGVARIDLAWTKPADEGDSAITGYRIEWSANGSANSWANLVADTGTTGVTYSDTGQVPGAPLGSETTRYYRVKAINAQAEGPASPPAHATTDDILGPVVRSARVDAAGSKLTIRFDEALESRTGMTPAKGAFEVWTDDTEAADRRSIGITGIRVGGSGGDVVELTGLLPAIRAGQAVTVKYNDEFGSMSAGDDTAALQDDDGNDAAGFTSGVSGVPGISNGSSVQPTAPVRPTRLAATAGGNYQIDLAWKAPLDTGGRVITGYRIEWSPDGDLTTWQELVADTDNKDVAYSDMELEQGTTRHYRVSAINAVGTGEASDPDDATTTRGAAGKVPSLTATPGIPSPPDGTTKVELAWTAPMDLGMPPTAITGYLIEWSAHGNDPWTELVANTGSTGVTYSDTGLPSETTRHYRVSAINGGGTGKASEPADATTADIVAPVPQSASVAANGDSLTIVFNEALDETPENAPAADSFDVTAADGTEFSVGSVTVSDTDVVLSTLTPTVRQGQSITLAYTDPTPNRDDTSAVIQDDDPGNDAASFTTGTGTLAAVENGSTIASEAPGQVTGLTAEPSGTDGIGLAWMAPYNGGSAITGYRIEWSANGTTNWQNLVADTGNAKTTRINDGLADGTERHYRISAINARGTGTASEVASAIVDARPPGAPAAPTDMTAKARAGGSIDLAWTAPVDTGDGPITGYRIEASADGASGWAPLVEDTGATATAHSDTTVADGVTRHYRVRAINGPDPENDIGPASASDEATADASGPVPQSASVAAHGTSLTIVFNERLDGTNLPAAGGFEVTAADGTEFEIGAVTASGTDSTDVTLSGLTPTIRENQSVTLAYTDPTLNTDDTSAALQDVAGNDAASFTTGTGTAPAVTNGSTIDPEAPGMPRDLRAAGGGTDRIVITWEPPAYNGGAAIASYLIEVSTDGTTFTSLVPAHVEMENGAILRRYVHMGLNVGDVRHYRVSATNSVGTGDPSATARGITVEPGTPKAPTGLSATPGLPATPDGTTFIALAWTAPVDTGDSAITGYRIEWSEDGNDPWTALAPDADSSDRRYSDTGLASETTRHYRVSAINGQGTGLPSASADATTDDIVAPVPQSASVADTGDSLTIVFNEALDETAANLPPKDGFGLTAADGTAFTIGAVAVSGTDVTLNTLTPTVKQGQALTLIYTDPTAGNDAAAIQDVAGNDAATFTTGTDSVAAVSNGSTQPVVVPGAPLQVRAAGGGADRIVITWDAPKYNGGAAIASYRIEVSADGDDPWTDAEATHNEMENGAILRRFVHMGLDVGDERHYRISATNSAGTGDPSATALGHAVAPGAPGRPRDLEATPGLPATPDGTTLIELAWDAPASTGASAITGYRIEWSADGNNPWMELVADTGNTDRRHSDTGLASETTRHYRVSAINAQGRGLPSGAHGATTADVIPPVLEYATVDNNGARIELNFDTAIDSAASGLPPKGAFTVTIDGAETGFGTVSAGPGNTDAIYLDGFSPTIKRGQTVRIAYTDPPNADDAAAIQDLSGNDAATFVTGEAGVPAVSNVSAQDPVAPDKPVNLRAGPGGEDRIVLTWEPPAYNGGTAITGYRIEWSANGSDGSWGELVANHAVMKDGAILRRYEHTGLMAGDERHYRVRAINSVDPGAWSDVASATTEVPGTVELSLASASVPEGEATEWTVTATSAKDERPEAGFAMEVRLSSADVSAEADVDYAALDTTLRFVRADFARKDIGGNDYRWVAEKSGTVDVTDDVEVEAEERFALEAAIVTSGVPFVAGTGQLEVSIPNTDSWGVEVTASPSEITEGETRAVTLSATVTPGEPGEGCVASFPITLGLIVGGEADDPGDYTLDAAPAQMRLAPCEAQASWQVMLAAKLETVPDADETVTFAPVIVGTPAFAVEEARLIPAPVTIREGRGVALSRTELRFREGKSATYTMSLTSQPTGPVRVRVEVSGDSDITLSPRELTFSPDDWHIAQTITVRAAQDGDAADDEAVVHHSVSGADYGANGITVASVQVAVHDDEGVPEYHGQVRLMEKRTGPTGGMMGRVQIGLVDEIGSDWGTICGDRLLNPGNLAPAVACRMLSYAGGHVVPIPGNARSLGLPEGDPERPANQDPNLQTMPILLDDLVCLAQPGGATPSSLLQCAYAGPRLHNCTHEEDLWVECMGSGTGTLPDLPALSVANAGIAESMGRPLPFVVSVSWESAVQGTLTETVSVDYATSDGSPEHPDRRAALAVGTPNVPVDHPDHAYDYAARSGTLTFTSSDTAVCDLIRTRPAKYVCRVEKPVAVPVNNDTVEDSGEVMTLTLSNPVNAQFADPVATGIIWNHEDELPGAPLKAAFVEDSLPASHDGATAFTLRLRFSVAIAPAEAAVREHGFVVIGGGLTAARRVAGETGLWELTVMPSSDAAVVLAPAALACGEAGALCTADGRALSHHLETTVAGPTPAPSIAGGGAGRKHPHRIVWEHTG